MKRINYLLTCLLSVLMVSSCIEYDNYETPKETIKGVVINKNTGKPFQTEVGENGLRIKLMEYSWDESPSPYYFYGKQDGSFQNTKIFKGDYGITIMGPFVPIPEEKHKVKGTLDLKFEVEPFLDIEWVGEPVINADKTVTVKATIKRGTSNPDYQQNVTDVRFYVSSGAPYVGENSKDERYCVFLSGGDAAAKATGETITFTTAKPLMSGYTYNFRVGARIDVEIDGIQRYNYNEVKTVQIP